MFLSMMAQLEKQIFYVLAYYTIDLEQVYAGLVLFELYHNRKIESNELLQHFGKCAFLFQTFPLIQKLIEIDQFIISY